MDYYQYDYDDVQGNEDDEEYEYVNGNENTSFFNLNEKLLKDLVSNCVMPTSLQILSYFGKLLGWNVLCRLLWTTFATKLRSSRSHIISIICGLGLLYMTIENASIYIILFAILSGIILKILIILKCKNLGYTVGGVSILVLAVCEILQPNPTTWHTIRGIQMVGTMKVISLAFDINLIRVGRNPTLFQILGYLLCPANVLLGPWISFGDYMNVFCSKLVGLQWVLWTTTNSILAFVFLILSNCIVPNLFAEDSTRWVKAFKDALAFRCSHYFISYLSQASMAASGVFTGTRANELTKWFGFTVTKPFNIELPRSLGQIVVSWNIPMHRWLKLYVFHNLKRHNTLTAILGTYLISSLLHGIHFQIYIVLLSLGFYSYVEYNLRLKISNVFNLCTLAKKCHPNASCQHDKTSRRLLFFTINGLFSFLTIFHLAYLGVMFDGAISSMEGEDISFFNSIKKWQILNFSSHWVVLVTYIIYLLI